MKAPKPKPKAGIKITIKPMSKAEVEKVARPPAAEAGNAWVKRNMSKGKR